MSSARSNRSFLFCELCAEQDGRNDNNINHKNRNKLRRRRTTHSMTSVGRFFDRISPLTLAVMQGRLSHVRHWLDHTRNCDVNEMDYMNLTALHRAAIDGHVAIVQLLATRGASLDIRTLNEKKDTALHLAARKGHVRVVSCLLKHGAFIDATNAMNLTPLLVATKANQKEVVQLLIARGANTSAPWAVTSIIEDELSSSSSSSSSHKDVGSCLHLAVQFGYLQLTKYFVSVVAMDVNQRTQRRRATPLHFAAKYAQLHICEFLLSHYADIRARDAGGMTPLHYTASYSYHQDMPMVQHEIIERKHVDVVVLLLKSGAKVKARRKSDRATPLRCAAKRGHFLIAKTLVDYGARSNRASLWLFALIYGGRDPEKVRFLLSSNSSKYHPYRSSSRGLSNNNSFTTESPYPLKPSTSMGTAKTRQSSLVRTSTTQLESPLVSPHSQPQQDQHDRNSSDSRYSILNEQDGTCTPLHVACRDMDLNLLKDLLTLHKVNIDARMLPDGLTALHLAASKGWLRGIAQLLSHGANVSLKSISSGSTALHLAAENGHIPAIGKLLAAGARVNVLDNTGASTLMVALRNGQSYTVKYLLRHGADPSTGSIYGDLMDDYNPQLSEQDPRLQMFDPKKTTAMHIAAFYGSLETLQHLVWDGAEVDARDEDGATPVWIAALMGHFEVVEYLAQQGANLSVVAKHGGGSVSGGAAEFGHLEVLEYLSTPSPNPPQVRRLSSLTRMSVDAQTSTEQSYSRRSSI